MHFSQKNSWMKAMRVRTETDEHFMHVAKRGMFQMEVASVGDLSLTSVILSPALERNCSLELTRKTHHLMKQSDEVTESDRTALLDTQYTYM